MKDLQELFESLGTDGFEKLVSNLDKKSLNPKTAQTIMDCISMVYCGEKNIEEAELTEEEMNILFESFSTSVAIYEGVRKGHMQINSGRMMLTNGESCSFSMTPEGIKHVEQMLVGK